jgi:rare lipoprotein A
VPDAVPRFEPLSRYGNPDSYVVFGKRYYTLKSSRDYTEQGVASWYGKKFHGRRTSSGEVYDMFAMTAAHRTLPLPTYVEVTNLENGSRAVVRVNDRGPFHDDRVLDLSYAAASKLGLTRNGTGLVRLQALEPGPVGSQSYEDSPVAFRGSRLEHLFVQVGAFSERLNAERVQQRVRVVADAAVDISTASKEGQDLYRVRIGPFGRIEDADRVVGRLTTLGLPGSQVVVEAAASGSLVSEN